MMISYFVTAFYVWRVSKYEKIGEFNYICFVFMAAYCFISIIAFSSKSSKEKELSTYNEAQSKSNVLKSGIQISTSMCKEYIKDIEDINKNIEHSRKYHDHWYLSPFYYKEIGGLQKIELDSLNIKLY